MAPNDAMERALAEIRLMKTPNIAAVARNHGVARRTLSSRFRGQALSRSAAASRHSKNLSDSQEKQLLAWIEKLTNQGTPPTSQIVANMAEEIAGWQFGHNWVSRFCKRYKEDIKSLYLRPIDQKRVQAENAAIFKEYYSIVRNFYITLSSIVD